MNIGFDGKRAVQNNTGLGNYSRYMIDILSRYYPDNQYMLYTPKRHNNSRLNQLLTNTNVSIFYPVSTIWKKLSSLWRVWGITSQLNENKVDLFHGLSNELPLTIQRGSFKKIVTIHDLIFIRFPQYYKFIDRKIYTYKFRKACLNADKIIAISECTKRDIMHFFHIPEEKIEVIYQNCDSSFSIPVPAERKKEIRLKYRLPERFILNVGSIEERKNVLLAVKALLNVPENIHLVIVGKRTAYTDKIDKFVQNNHLTGRVHLLHHVTFNDLPGVYQMADIFVYPSRFEGFGIPIVEALHSGVPVVAATGSCLEEAGGPDSVYVDPDDVEGMSTVFNRLLPDASERERMVERGKEYVVRFSDEKVAERVMELYRISII